MKKQSNYRYLFVFLTSGVLGAAVFTMLFACALYVLHAHGLFLGRAHAVWGLFIACLLGVGVTWLLEKHRGKGGRP